MKVSEEAISKIIDEFSNDREFIVSRAFGDSGIDPLSARLLRAATDQVAGGEAATPSRYAIWANTVRDNIIQADAEFANGNILEARRLLRRAANSMSAFSEIQALFDLMEIGGPTKRLDRVR